MKVLGLLSFYDELPEHLTAAITSLAAHGVDHVVVCDGAYALFPDGQGSSPCEQHDAIRTAAGDAAIGCTLHVPPGPWQGNEIEKRTTLFALGHSLAEPSVDWLFVHDADEIVTAAGDYRAVLEQTSLDVGSLMHSEQGVRPRPERRLFRAHPGGIRVERAHFYYRNGDDEVLWGPQQVDRELLDVHVLHRPWERTPERRQGRKTYYENRLVMHAELEV